MPLALALCASQKLGAVREQSACWNVCHVFFKGIYVITQSSAYVKNAECRTPYTERTQNAAHPHYYLDHSLTLGASFQSASAQARAQAVISHMNERILINPFGHRCNQHQRLKPFVSFVEVHTILTTETGDN